MAVYYKDRFSGAIRKVTNEKSNHGKTLVKKLEGATEKRIDKETGKFVTHPKWDKLVGMDNKGAKKEMNKLAKGLGVNVEEVKLETPKEA